MKHRRLFQQSFLAISSVFFAFPYLLMLFCCFSTDAGIKGNTLFGSLSVDHFLSNLSNTFRNQQFITAFFNSCLVSSIASVLTLLVSSLAAFGLSIVRASWSKFLLAVIVFSLSLSQTPWNLIRGMATPKQPVSHQATPSIDQSPVSVNRARFIFSEGICL